MLETLTGSLLGILLGVRHALDPDHLAAVSTLVTEQPKASRGALLGVFWGIGHALALLAAGVMLALLRTKMPPRLADFFEFAVALMLVALGLRAIHRALRHGRTGPSARHPHRASWHEHPGQPDHVHMGAWTFARRPLLVGLVHGLAGSGSLTALALASLPSAGARLTYIALFGFGSIAGMTLLSGMVGWPLARIGRNPTAARLLSACAGALSTSLGVLWGLPLALHWMR